MLKFHTIARYQLVSIFKKCKPQSEVGVIEPGVLPGVPATPTPSTTPAIQPPAPPTPISAPAPPSTAASFDRANEKEDKQTFQVSDCRSLVKTLVCGVKTITWGITSCKAPGGETTRIHVNPARHYVSRNDCFDEFSTFFLLYFFPRGSIHSEQAASTKRDTNLH